MTHAVSATYTRFDHMSPTAALLAVLLHALTALALWLVSPLSHRDIEVEPVLVTLEEPPAAAAAAAPQTAPRQPSPATPVVPPAARATPPAQPAPAKPLGITPPPPKADTPQQAKQQEQASPSEKQETARPPEPPLEPALPPIETPPPPLTSQDFPKPPPKPAPPAKPLQQSHVAPSPPSQQQRLMPSPLSPHQNPTQQATAPTTTFVNPADTYVHTRARDEYLWQVIGKFSQYLPKLWQSNQGGTVVLSFSIGRDGRLIDVTVTKSSGVAALDRGLVEAIRAAAPYPPLPSEIPGDHVTYTQPISAKQ